jgi:hypothetical protein
VGPVVTAAPLALVGMLGLGTYMHNVL